MVEQASEAQGDGMLPKAMSHRQRAVVNKLRHVLADSGISETALPTVDLHTVLDVLAREEYQISAATLGAAIDREVSEIKEVMDARADKSLSKRRVEEIEKIARGLAVAVVSDEQRHDLDKELDQWRKSRKLKDFTSRQLCQRALDGKPLDWENMKPLLVPKYTAISSTEDRAWKHYVLIIERGLYDGWLICRDKPPLDKADEDLMIHMIDHPEWVTLDNTALPQDIKKYMDDLSESLLELERTNLIFIDKVMRLLVMQQLVSHLSIDENTLRQVALNPIVIIGSLVVQLTTEELDHWFAREYANELQFQVSLEGFGVQEYHPPKKGGDTNTPLQE